MDAGDHVSDIQAITYSGSATVTKANSGTDPAGPFAGLLVTAAGTLKFTLMDTSVITLSSTSVGQIIPIATQLVWSTGTSATVVGLYAAGPFKGGNNWGAA
jgi:hypothetical protein